MGSGAARTATGTHVGCQHLQVEGYPVDSPCWPLLFKCFKCIISVSTYYSLIIVTFSQKNKLFNLHRKELKAFYNKTLTKKIVTWQELKDSIGGSSSVVNKSTI